MEEIWKNVKGYEGLYQISNLGRVKSMEKSHVVNSAVIKRKERIISQFINPSGYYTFNLHKDNKGKTAFVHKLVAEAFIDNPNAKEYKEVNHIDHNKLNNRVDNLEWCDRKMNMEAMAKFYGIEQKRNYCECGKEIHRESNLCVNCLGITNRKVKERPSKEELLNLIKTTPFSSIGKMYNVSDNAIRRWCKDYNLPHTKKDIKLLGL